MLEKEKVLENATKALNKEDQPWEVTVEGEKIIASWKWMDATFFSAKEVDNEIKSYKCIISFGKDGKYKETDYTSTKSNYVKYQDGKLKIGHSESAFKGKVMQKSFNMGVGKDNKTGNVGIITHKFSTSIIKKAIKEYMEECGWKKAGLFG